MIKYTLFIMFQGRDVTKPLLWWENAPGAENYFDKIKIKKE